MRILFFAHLKTTVGRGELELDCDDVDADELWQRLGALHPELARFRRFVRLARNAEYVGPDARFRAADEVALIPPVSGG